MTGSYTLRPPVPAKPEERSYWIRAAGEGAHRTCAVLEQNITADVAIVGGGLTGLWTAWRIIEQSPDTRVVVLEADFCGSGASGRNGGQIHSWYSSLAYLRAIVGNEEAIRLARATSDAITEIEKLDDTGQMPSDVRLDGWILGASSKAQEGAWDGFISLCAEYGDKPFRVLGRTELRARTGGDDLYAGCVEDHAGTINPYKLVESLKAALIARGVEIYEGTPVTSIADDQRVTLTTPAGKVTAGKSLVATNVWAGSIPELNRYMYAVDAQVLTTTPIPEKLDELGWTGGEAFADGQIQVLYYQRTIDGRVLLGQGSGQPVFKDHFTSKNNFNPRLVQPAVDELHRLYPELKDVEIEYAWVGAVDVSATHLPVLGQLKGTPNVHYCVGWSGTALAQIPVVARILAANLLDADDEWARSPLFNPAHRQGIFPEPFRYLGAIVVRRAVMRRVRLEIQNKKVDAFTRLLVALMPKNRLPRGMKRSQQRGATSSRQSVGAK